MQFLSHLAAFCIGIGGASAVLLILTRKRFPEPILEPRKKPSPDPEPILSVSDDELVPLFDAEAPRTATTRQSSLSPFLAPECYVSPTCYPRTGVEWLSLSILHLTWDEHPGDYGFTGTLLNNTARDGRLLVLTVRLGAPTSLPAGFLFAGFVKAADTVEIRLYNVSSSTVSLPAGVWTVEVGGGPEAGEPQVM